MTILAGDLRTLSYEATQYLYPLVLMDITRLQAVNTPTASSPIAGPHNEFHHIRAFPTADFRAVVRPNFDTLYSSAWLDLTGGAVIVHAPDTDDRYYMLPMLDMWTDVFANPGKRTTGTAAQQLVLVPPGYAGHTPVGTTRIQAPTPHVWVIGRTQTNGPADFEAVHAFQDGLEVVELGSPVEQQIDPVLDMDTEPLNTVNAMRADEFFSYAGEVLRTVPPHGSDWDQLARMSRLGLIPGVEFAAAGFSTAELDELEAGLHDAHQAMAAATGLLAPPYDGWVAYTDTMGVYGNHYLKRALVTLVGLGANPAEDAIYPLLLTDADG